jgi:hypothetical protein
MPGEQVRLRQRRTERMAARTVANRCSSASDERRSVQPDGARRAWQTRPAHGDIQAWPLEQLHRGERNGWQLGSWRTGAAQTRAYRCRQFSTAPAHTRYPAGYMLKTAYRFSSRFLLGARRSVSSMRIRTVRDPTYRPGVQVHKQELAHPWTIGKLGERRSRAARMPASNTRV